VKNQIFREIAGDNPGKMEHLKQVQLGRETQNLSKLIIATVSSQKGKLLPLELCEDLQKV
jgi:hypothetical protein